MVDGVCVPVTLECPPGFIVIDGICFLDTGSIFCSIGEEPDPLTGNCVCSAGYTRDPDSGVCERDGLRSADKFDLRGFVADLHAGRNWQRGSVVYGIERDVDYANVKGSSDFLYSGGAAGTLSWRSDWQASLRLRIGYAKDRTLFYGTGGIAFGHATLDGSSAGFTASDSNTHVGWTVGAGVERASRTTGSAESRCGTPISPTRITTLAPLETASRRAGHRPRLLWE